MPHTPEELTLISDALKAAHRKGREAGRRRGHKRGYALGCLHTLRHLAPLLKPGHKLHKSAAAAHAPKGGVTIGGKRFAGGEFIPGDVMAKATEAEREAVEGGGTKTKQGEAEEWDGTIEAGKVDYNSLPWAETNYAQWSDDEGGEHEIYLEAGKYTPPGADEPVKVYRFVSFTPDDKGADREEEGEWTTDRDEARDQGEEYARDNHQEQRDPEDDDIDADDVTGQSWNNREEIGRYMVGGGARTVRLEEGEFEFGGRTHTCYRWSTRLDEDGEWTLDRRQAVRDGEEYAEEFPAQWDPKLGIHVT